MELGRKVIFLSGSREQRPPPGRASESKAQSFYILCVAVYSTPLYKSCQPSWLSAPTPGQYICVLPQYSNISSAVAWPIKTNFYEASIGRGDQCVYKKSRSHDQDGRHVHIW